MATRRAEVVVGSRKANLIINKIHTLLRRAKGKRLKTKISNDLTVLVIEARSRCHTVDGKCPK